jgi:hypothetical protein
MAMTYTSLLADKGVAGSIKNWVGYSVIDTSTILDEAQSMIYSALRVREMKTVWVFGLLASNSKFALPARFLEPLGAIRDTTNNFPLEQKDQPVIESARSYNSGQTGSFGANAFSTLLGSNLVDVNLAAHPLTQGSTIVPAGVAPVGGLNLNTACEVVEVTSSNSFTMSTGDNVATSSATGGGSGGTYKADVLISGTVGRWAIFDEHINFDFAVDNDTNFRLPYIRSPQLLSASNPSNWLTNRYPKLLRVATTAAAAEQMKDDQEFQKQSSVLTALIQGINIENEMYLRGSVIETDTPTPGDYY